MLQMGVIVTGLEKSSYESFALQADLSVWLLGKTGHKRGHTHDLTFGSNFSRLIMWIAALIFFKQTFEL